MIKTETVILSVLFLSSSTIYGQSLFETAGQDSSERQFSSARIELGGYTRGTLYIGENENNAEVSSGYGEAALKLRFIFDNAPEFKRVRVRVINSDFHLNMFVTHPRPLS